MSHVVEDGAKQIVLDVDLETYRQLRKQAFLSESGHVDLTIQLIRIMHTHCIINQ